jgi:DNA adenine methylase
MYQNPELFTPVQRVWALWTLANSSYGCMLDGVFGYDHKGTTSKKLDNKRLSFVSDYAERLRQVRIECCDAVRIIKSRGCAGGLFLP